MQIPFFYKTQTMNEIPLKPSKGYMLLKKWVSYVFENLYYKRIYRINKEKIPSPGTPVVCVSNHQNSLLDAFQMLYATDNFFVHFISRADVFRNKKIAKLLYGLGLIPIYRVRDGMDKLRNNLQMFDEVEHYVNNGGMLVIYPEATHMNGNWLGRFYHSYVRIAFETAAITNYAKEVFILPATLYYEDFKALQKDSLIIYSDALSLKPFYEMYQNNPRQTEEEVSRIVRHRVQEQMLDVKDVDNYVTVMDFIRYSETAYAEKSPETDMTILPQALKVRRELEAKLSALMGKEDERLGQIYSHTSEYSRLLKKYGIDDYAFRHPARPRNLLGSALLALILLPIYIIGMLPHLPLYFIAPLVTRKLEDKLMYASIDICVWILGIPLFYLIYFLLLGFTGSWLFALIFILILPPLGKFAIWYHRNIRQDWKRFRAKLLHKSRPKAWKKMGHLREELDKDLESLM